MCDVHGTQEYGQLQLYSQALDYKQWSPGSTTVSWLSHGKWPAIIICPSYSMAMPLLSMTENSM